ncbi:MAG: hypothetical protein IJF76_03420 [Clostridia bacterium]|nr:hypothetical protein [Clostridia bacterium]
MRKSEVVDYSEFYYHKGRKTQKRRRSTPTKKQIRAKRLHYIAILSIIICFCATLYFFDYLKGGAPLSAFDTLSDSTLDVYYCVQTGLYDDKHTAQYYAEKVKSKGGAGYLAHDQSYSIVTAIYDEEDKAVVVSNRLNLSGENYVVQSISLSPIFDSSLPLEERNAVYEISRFYDVVYDELYDLSNGIDQDIYNVSEVKSRITSLIDTLTHYQTKISTITPTAEVLALSSTLKSCIVHVQNATASYKAQDLRYAYVATLYSCKLAT